MTKYIATGKPVFNDSEYQTVKFEAKDDKDARNWIINHCDCSLEWNFEKLELSEENKKLLQSALALNKIKFITIK